MTHYALLLNDMRSGHIEDIQVVRADDDHRVLLDWYTDQLADEPYMDGHWWKHFKKGSELEWFNKSEGLDPEGPNDYFGGLWKFENEPLVGMSLYKG